MIRMGRSSKTEQMNDAAYQPTQTTNSNSLYPAGNASSNRAVSESESMARDIKEGRLSGFIGTGTVLTGETTFQAILRIDGHLTGRVLSEDGTLIVGSTGRVDANIHVAAATINGTINGDVVATERLELGRTAHVVGNIQTPRLLMEDGAILEGGCGMMKARETMEKLIAEANESEVVDERALFQQNEPDEYLELNDDEAAQGAAN